MTPETRWTLRTLLAAIALVSAVAVFTAAHATTLPPPHFCAVATKAVRIPTDLSGEVRMRDVVGEADRVVDLLHRPGAPVSATIRSARDALTITIRGHGSTCPVTLPIPAHRIRRVGNRAHT